MQDEVANQRALKKRLKMQRKAAARARKGGTVSTDLTAKPKAPPEPPLWLNSGSMEPVTTPMFPTQVPFRPTVVYTDKAWAKIQFLIHRNSLEVGWWGIVEKNGNTYTVLDVFVPKQVVSGGTTEISGDGLNKVVDDLLVSQGHADNLLYWGHLHPTFSCSPSYTDEKTTQGFVDALGNPGFFIRGIYNKKGESKVDVYVKDTPTEGWIFQSVVNMRQPATLNADEMNQFSEICKQNVETYAPTIQRQPTTGQYTKIIPDPQHPGLYKMREGSYPEATQGVLADLDDGVISYDDLETLQDPYGVKGEGYGTN